jgi:hypothetical protein
MSPEKPAAAPATLDDLRAAARELAGAYDLVASLAPTWNAGEVGALTWWPAVARLDVADRRFYDLLTRQGVAGVILDGRVLTHDHKIDTDAFLPQLAVVVPLDKLVDLDERPP